MRCCVRTLLVSMLMLLATRVSALKAPDPGNAAQQSAPAPAETSATTPTVKAPTGKTPAPARPSSEERVRADSAVSFPVDI